MRFALVLIAALSLCAAAMGQAKSESATGVPDNELLLRELAHRWIEADVRGDAATVSSLLADEFSFLGGSNRTQYLAAMNPDPSLKVETVVIEDLKVQMYGDTAVVTGLNSYRFKKDGAPVATRFPSMTVWVKKSGRWQCVKACVLPGLTS